MNKKALHYAYPTSPMAEKYLAPYGVWYVTINGEVTEIFPNYHHLMDCKNKLIDRRWDALEHFESLDLPIDRMESFTRDSLPFQRHGEF